MLESIRLKEADRTILLNSTRVTITAKTPVRHQDTIHTGNMDTMVTIRDKVRDLILRMSLITKVGPPSFPNLDFHYNDRRGSYDSSSYGQCGFSQTNGNVDRNPKKYPWNSTEHMANMSSDNVTPWHEKDLRIAQCEGNDEKEISVREIGRSVDSASVGYVRRRLC
jgi:hypothetical protein